MSGARNGISTLRGSGRSSKACYSWNTKRNNSLLSPQGHKKTEFSLMKNLTFRLLRTYAEARFGAATCSTNFPRVWPATPRSNASLALASGIVSAMTGRIAPESINAAISPSCSRLGSTMKNSPCLLWAAASPPGMGPVKLTRIPVGFNTCQDRSRVAPPIVSRTTSILWTTCSNCDC
jgi:hypothetical protein